MGPFKNHSSVDEEEEEDRDEGGVGREEGDEEEEVERKRKGKFKASKFDEEDEQGEPRSRKRRHGRGSMFIDDSAAVASDDEDEDEDDGEEDFIFDETAAEVDEEDDRRHPRHHHRSMLPMYEQEENIDDWERRLEQRFAGQDYDVFDEAEPTEVEQQALLPSVKDPKLWMLECKAGQEREAAICLMQKYLDMDIKSQPLLIKSAIALDHLVGYIYIESDKEAYVRQAIRGLRMFPQSKMTIVPIKEMTDVLSVKKKSVDVEQDSWVRVKSGTYKGDLAKVVDVDHVGQCAAVKLIPRVELHVVAAKLEGRHENVKGRPRPLPKFINSLELQDLRIPVERKRDPNHAGEYFEFFGGMQFKDGYLYRFVSLTSIDSSGILPSFEELEKYQKPGGKGAIDAAGLRGALMSKRKGQFVEGDAVIVVHGDLKNLMGIVVKVDDDNIHIRPKDEKLIVDSLLVKESQLCKFFKIGDHVKVVAGTHEGATGMIVRAGAECVVILSDTTREDIKVFTANVVESSEVTSGLIKLGKYELHDLVLLENSTVGLIVRVDRDGCQVLKGIPDRAEVMTVKRHDMKKKIFDRNVEAQDWDGNSVSLTDMVRVVKGPYKGRQGPAQHIHRGLLFVRDHHHLENGGYLCVRAGWCVAFGGTRSGIVRGRERGGAMGSYNDICSVVPNYLQSLRRSAQQYDPRQGGTCRGRQGGGSKRDHSLVGTTVKIRIGPFKGCRGRVVDARDTDVRIELESQMKVVAVRRDQLSDPVASPVCHGRNAYQVPPRSAAGSETPLHPSRTPMHPAFMTPVRDPSGAPSINDGMRTPMRDRAWNPHTTMNTPLRVNTWDNAGRPSTWNEARTPTYNQPGTPGGRRYEAPTPGTGWASTPGASFGDAGTPIGSSGGPADYGNPASHLPGTPVVPTYLPSTPGGEPMTPGLDPTSPAAAGMGRHEPESKWELLEVAVSVRRAGEDAQIGVIQEAMVDGTYRVALGTSGHGDIVIVTHSEIELVVPEKADRIKIVSGELRGSTGKLIGIDGGDGIVKMDDTLDIKILDMSSLAKMVAN